ncbi:MAG: serine/threonine protein kinase [Lautropia sp.]
MTSSVPQPFRDLDPARVLATLEAAGLDCDGRLQALNSFENRVYFVGLHDGGSRVAKFYRPGRWSDAQIREEHAFAAELADAEIPVVAPLPLADGQTLFCANGHRVAVFPRQGGRVPELDNARDGAAIRDRIGQFIARIHTVGARRRFAVRPALTPDSHARQPIAVVRASGLLTDEAADAWIAVATRCADRIAERYDAIVGRDGCATLRLHGDCHLGNLLWTDHGAHFVDLDDARTGPAAQDLWMLADAGAANDHSPAGASAEWAELIAGYERIRDFDRRELALVETLRTMRMLHYCGWLAERWQDPAFPAAFPWFGTPRYWQDQIIALREQLERLDEPAQQYGFDDT